MREQTIAAVTLLSLGALPILVNWMGFEKARRTGVGFSSVPILSGFFGCMGLLLLPSLRMFAFIPPLVDLGCLPTLAALVAKLLSSAFEYLY